MKPKTFKNRAVALVLALITIVSVGATSAHAASLSDGNSKTVTIKMGTRHSYLETTNGNALGGEAWTYTTDDNISGPAYCINWGLKSAPSTKALPITGIYTNSPKTIGAFSNGYPQRSLDDFKTIHASEYDFTALTEDEYAYATQIAIWASLGQLAVEGTSFTAGRATLDEPTSNAQMIRTFKAVTIILQNANHWTKPLKTGMTIRAEKDRSVNIVDIQDDKGILGASIKNAHGIHQETINGVEYFTRIFYASSMTSTWKNGYIIDIWADNAPSGTIFTNEANALLASGTKDGKTKYEVPVVARNTPLNENGSEYYGSFKICMPVSTTPANGDVTINSSSIITQFNIYQAYNSDETQQSYVIADPMYAPMTAKATLKWATKESIYGKLLVEKVDGSGKPLAGASFKLEGGGKTYSGTSDADGVVTWEQLDPYIQYTLTETSAPAGFQITAPVNVAVIANQSVTITVTNHSEHTFRIRKIDAQNGFPLGQAVFRFEQIDGSYVTTATTGQDGYIEFVGGTLPYGSYRVTETQAPSGYLKDTSVQTVNWTGRDDITLTFKDVRKPTIILIKKDESTNESLENAVFNVYKNGQLVTSVTTNRAGEARVLDVTPGYYEFEEIQAPAGYLLDGTRHGINVNPYDPATENDPVLVVNNKARPSIRILKIDVITGKPLPNAEFSVGKVQGTTESEYITDASGEIIIKNLDEAIYYAEEFMAPDGYIRVDTRKEIQTESGKIKTLKFDNIRKPVLLFLKTNGLTGNSVPGATFKVEYETPGGGLKTNGSYKTGADGKIVIPKAEPGWYVFTETAPAPGFSLPENPVTRVHIEAGQNAYLPEYEHYYTGGSAPSVAAGDFTTMGEVSSGSEYIVQGEGVNWPLNSIVIKKTHAITGELLAGAAFELYRADEQVSGVPGTNIGRYTTDNSGVVVITGLSPGYYVVKEVQAPQNFLISENSQQNGFLKADGTTVLEFTFANYPYGAILISKADALTGTPLAGAKFKVTDNAGTVVGNTTGEYVTDSKGEILIPNVKPGAYVVTEIQAPANYAINTTPKTVQVGTDGKTYKVSFDNYPYGALVIKKYDSVSKQPLSGAEFKVTMSDGSVVGTSNGIFKTDANGTITIPNLPKGSYIVTEIKAPTGYILDNQAQTIAVDYGKAYTLDFFNNIKSGMQIIKIDAITKQPLKDAKFTVYKKSGDVIGEYVTDKDGLIIIDNLEPGWYKAVETKAPNGYVLDDTPKDFEVTSNQFIKLTFENRPLAGLQIKKISELDGSPLIGAQFKVTKQNGEYVGEYTTDANGFINIPELAPGWYVIAETKAPSGFILDNTPKTVEVKTAEPTVVTFTNKPLSGAQIKKIDSVTRQPIQGVEFTVTKMNGERIGSYKTDKSGLIYLPELESGWYVIAEVKAAEGYILDAAPRNIEIKWGEPVFIEIENTPISGLLIIKTDASNGKPLAGVKFQIAKTNGERIGLFTTDANGRIYANDLPAGKYVITETEALKGYELDTKAYEVTVRSGKQEVVEIKNKPLGGLRLLKIDSITKKPIYNVEFMLFDGNGKVVGTYYTDNNGVIDFSAILTEGRYTIRETRAAKGYYLDEIPKTVEFVSGKVTEIVWTNTPQMGQIQLIKKSGDDNEANGLPAGTPLAGAIFEVYEYKSGNLVDRFVSGADGRAVSKPLPLGRYIVKEVQAPQWYKLSTQALDIELEFATQIIKQEFLNYSANTGVYIKKTGPVECMPGDTIRYDIKAVQNTSTVPLTDFYWRDTLPTDAVRLTKIITGTYNQSLKYKVMITTNKGDTRIIADNLSATKNNVIDCSNASLGLKNDEYVTSFTLVFGTVKAGFAQVEQPQIFVKVLSTLPGGYQFSNKVDVGGKYGREWVVGNSTWLTTVYKKNVPLPRTGY